MKKIITLTVLLVVSVATVGFFYFDNRIINNSDQHDGDVSSKKESGDSALLEYKKVLEIPKSNEVFSVDSLPEYIEQLESVIWMLDKAGHTEERDMAKVIYYKTLPYTKLNDQRDSEERNALMIEAYTNLLEIRNTYKPSRNYIYIRASLAIENIYNSCYIDDLLEKSAIGQDPEYLKFTAQYPGKLGKFMYIRNLLEDIYYINNYAATEYAMETARILENFDTQLSPDDTTKLVVSLEKAIRLSKSLPETTVFSEVSKPQRTGASVIADAYAYGILERYKDDIQSEDVIKKYESSRNTLNAIAETTNYYRDAQDRNYLSLLYMSYLFDLNGKTINEKITDILDVYIEFENSPLLTKELSANRNFYLINTQTDMGNWDRTRLNLVLIAKQYKPLKDFLEKKGLVI